MGIGAYGMCEEYATQQNNKFSVLHAVRRGETPYKIITWGAGNASPSRLIISTTNSSQEENFEGMSLRRRGRW